MRSSPFLLDKIEKLPLINKLFIAWLLCVLPRVLFFIFLANISVNDLIIEGAILRSSKLEYWYPFYHYVFGFFVWKVCGGNLFLFVIINIFLSAMIGPIVYLLCKNFRLSHVCGWISVVGVAFMPYYISTPAKQFQSSITIVLFATLILLYVVWLINDLSLKNGLMFTAFCFIFTLLRPNTIATIIPLYLAAVFLSKISKDSVIPASYKKIFNVLILMGIFAGMILGLAGFNKITKGHFAPFPPNVGFNLYLGNNPYVSEFLWRHDINSLQDIAHYHKGPAALYQHGSYENDRLLLHLALKYMVDNPGQTLKNILLKSIAYWDFLLSNAKKIPLYWNIAYTIPYLCYLVMAIAGTVVWWRQKQQRHALYLIIIVIVSYWLPHVIFFPTIRFRMTTEFLLIIMASYGLASFIEKPSG